MKKCGKWATSLCAIAAVVLSLLPSPVSAAEINAIDAADYVSNVVVDGDNKAVYYTFDGFTPLHYIYSQPSGEGIVFDKTMSYYQAPDGATSMSGVFYWLGVSPSGGGVAPSEGLIDVSDISPGAIISIGTQYSIRFSTLLYNGGPYRIITNTSVYCFDSDGNFIDQIHGDATGIPVAESFNLNINKVDSFELPYGTHYIIPKGTWSVTADDNNVRALVLEFSIGSFQMNCGVNMILDQSQTMEEVKDKLEDMNELQQETNDKLDEIISDAPEQQEEIDKIKDEIANQGQIVDDALAEKNELLNKPDPGDAVVDMDDYIDSYYNGQMTNVFAVFSAAQFPSSMIALVCGIILVSYVLFGKK